MPGDDAIPGRRGFLLSATAMATLGAGCASQGLLPLAPPGSGIRYLNTDRGAPSGIVEDLARRTFRFFWETTDAATGLAPDRYPTSAPCSIAAIGFALTAYAIGVGREYISRQEARARTLVTLRFLYALPQVPQVERPTPQPQRQRHPR